jgi:hypothetical protein
MDLLQPDSKNLAKSKSLNINGNRLTDLKGLHLPHQRQLKQIRTGRQLSIICQGLIRWRPLNRSSFEYLSFRLWDMDGRKRIEAETDRREFRRPDVVTGMTIEINE